MPVCVAAAMRGQDLAANGNRLSACKRRRQACVVVTKVVTPTPSTVNTTSRNEGSTECRSGTGISISAASWNDSVNKPNSVKATPPHSSVRAAVVRAMLRIA